MRKHDENIENQKWATYRIIVPTEEEKQELLEASEHIHDSDIDTDYIYVNSIAHIYYNPNYYVIVDKELYDKLEKEYQRDSKSIDEMEELEG